MTSGNLPVVVIGDGWAAMSSVAFLAAADQPVTWVTATGARLLAPLPSLDAANDGAKTWELLAKLYSLDAGELIQGNFLREFRNKAFREAAWTKAPTPEARKDVRDELLGENESFLAPLFEARLPLTPAEIEEKVRVILAERSELVRRIEGVPVQEVGVESGAVSFIRLASGETLKCERVIYADRWDQLARIEGLPKGITFHRKRYPVGVLQAEFEHEQPVPAGIQEGFFGALHKETGETHERHVWGFFTTDGKKSVWSLCISSEEGEENHTIAKRLRRMKGALDKMFSGSGWLPEGKAEYLSNIASERVRFEEAILYTAGEAPQKPLSLPGVSGLNFLTDGYGPTEALRQVASLLQPAEAGADAQAEDVDSSDPSLA
ncbi:MAG: hypothetical protein P4M08_05720 [Oligoflexia bacterium]|nr:hypothetical protein [Oligoflexia bacterium]